MMHDERSCEHLFTRRIYRLDGWNTVCNSCGKCLLVEPAEHGNSNTDTTLSSSSPVEKKEPLENKPDPPHPLPLAPRVDYIYPPISPESQISSDSSSLCNSAHNKKSCAYINNIILRDPWGLAHLRYIFRSLPPKEKQPESEITRRYACKITDEFGKPFMNIDVAKEPTSFNGLDKKPEKLVLASTPRSPDGDSWFYKKWIDDQAEEYKDDLVFSHGLRSFVDPEKKSSERKRSYNIEPSSLPVPSTAEPGISGKLYTRQNNCMSLSCRGSIKIENGIIIEVDFSGYPRTHGDYWTYFYKNAKRGDSISEKEIKDILSYDGSYDVKSGFEPSEDRDCLHCIRGASHIPDEPKCMACSGPSKYSEFEPFPSVHAPSPYSRSWQIKFKDA